MSETMLSIRPSELSGTLFDGANRAVEFGFTDARNLPLADPERLGPNTDLIEGISRTVGEIVLSHATGRNDSHAQDQANVASGLSALGNILTQKDRSELLEAQASVIEVSKHPLAIDSILNVHAAYQDAIRRSTEVAMSGLDNSDSEEEPAKKTKTKKNKENRTSLLGDAIARANTDTN